MQLLDIYSMGAILHCIIFGLPPTESSHDCRSKEYSLSIGISKIPRIRYLVAIAYKAISHDRLLRYQSAEAIRDDLLRWIEGESIHAVPELWIERAGRWISKHRTLASGVISAIGITVLAGSVFLWYQSIQKQLINEQAEQLRVALKDSAILLREAQDAHHVAEQSQRETQLSREQALKSREVAEKREILAFEGLLRFQDILLDNQSAFESERLIGVRDMLILQTKATFDGILGNLSDRPSPQMETLKYLTILTHRLAAMQTRAGKHNESLATIDQACAWMQRSSGIVNLSEDYKNKLHQRIGELKSLQGNISLLAGYGLKARPIVQEAIDRLEPLISKQLISSEQLAVSTAALAQAYAALSSIELHFGEIEDAIIAQRKSLSLLSNPDPMTFSSAMAAAQSHYGMAILYERANDVSKAIDEFSLATRALKLGEDIQEGKMPLEFLEYRSQVVFHQANLLYKYGRVSEAIEVTRVQVAREAEEIANSHDPQKSLLAYQRSAEFLQAMYVETGNLASALELCQRWVETARKLTVASEQSVQVRYFSTMALHISGHLEERLQNFEKAKLNYQEAIEHFTQVEIEASQQANFLLQRIELEIHILLLQHNAQSLDETETNFSRAVQATRLLLELPNRTGADLEIAVAQLRRGVDTISKISNAAAAKWESTLLGMLPRNLSK